MWGGSNPFAAVNNSQQESQLAALNNRLAQETAAKSAMQSDIHAKNELISNKNKEIDDLKSMTRTLSAGQAMAYNAEATQLTYMSDFLNKQMSESSQNAATLDTVSGTIEDEYKHLNKEIESIRADIRKEKRIFLDSDVSTSPAVGVLYFTLVTDNQILIAFMSCMGAFLLFCSALILLNKIPLYYFESLTYPNRIVTVAILWSTAIIFTYLFFFAFT